MLKRLIAILAAGAALSTSAAAAPQTDCPGDDCVVVGKWNFSIAVGAGIRTNPVVGMQNLPIVLVPEFSYYGERFFIDNLDFGFTLVDAPANTLSLIASPDYDRAFFYKSDLQNIFVSLGSPDVTGRETSTLNSKTEVPGTVSSAFPSEPRHITYLAGPEWTFKYFGVTGQLDLLHEITAQDHGNEVRAALGVPLLPKPNALSLNLGVTWKSAAIVNYYYGAPGVYEGGSALDPFIKLSYVRPLSRKWRFNAMVQYERLGDAIGDSPIIAKECVITAFVGAIYTF
jgi:MipA family protein